MHLFCTVDWLHVHICYCGVRVRDKQQQASTDASCILNSFKYISTGPKE
jgi:hypothetical protein